MGRECHRIHSWRGLQEGLKSRVEWFSHLLGRIAASAHCAGHGASTPGSLTVRARGCCELSSTACLDPCPALQGRAETGRRRRQGRSVAPEAIGNNCPALLWVFHPEHCQGPLEEPSLPHRNPEGLKAHSQAEGQIAGRTLCLLWDIETR